MYEMFAIFLREIQETYPSALPLRRAVKRDYSRFNLHPARRANEAPRLAFANIAAAIRR